MNRRRNTPAPAPPENNGLTVSDIAPAIPDNKNMPALNFLKSLANLGFVTSKNGEAIITLHRVDTDPNGEKTAVLREVPVNLLHGLTAWQTGRLAEMVDPVSEARSIFDKLAAVHGKDAVVRMLGLTASDNAPNAPGIDTPLEQEQSAD